MDYVDYQKLAEQYASFLVAIGGVSITVLALVISLGSNPAKSSPPKEGDSRSFLVTALVVAALSCFVGAQMMAETAAFTNYTELGAFPNPIKKADPLFLLASSNIFIAIVLVFFALIFLPFTSGQVHLPSIKPITILFFVIVAGALYWAVLAGLYRMDLPARVPVIVSAIVVGAIWGAVFWHLKVSKRTFLWLTFGPSALVTIISLGWFAWIYSGGNPNTLKTAEIQEVIFFSFAITISYASLLVAGFKNMLGKKPMYTPEEIASIRAMMHWS